MKRQDKISFYKSQLETAKELKVVAQQNYNIATRLESEAKSALELLGAKPTHTRKGIVLPESLKIKLMSNLTPSK